MKHAGPASLSARIGLLFAMVATLTFAGVGAYLYRSMEIQLEVRNDRDLLSKIGQIRHLLTETASPHAIRADPHRFIDTMGEDDGLILILKSTEGSILLQNHVLQNHAALAALPELPIAQADQNPDNASLRTWPLPSGLSVRAVSAWGRLENQREQVQIVVARTASHRLTLLAEYRTKVFAAVCSGALLAALLGYLLVLRGMHPVRAIASQAGAITAQRLETRLDAAAAPIELRMLAESFNGMLDRLHGSFQRLSQFSADLAHDLRTPINNLIVQTQVALSQPRSADEYQALLASNIEEYERLARMVESMLFLARADHAHVALDKQILDSGTELRRIADYFEGVAGDAGVRFALEANGTVLADAILLRRAVSNLVANAIQYTPAGGVIRLAAQASNAATVIAVENPGLGIDAQHIPRLFDRFYRADQARSDSASSAGLGLAIVESIMKLHGGQARVESNSDLTTFSLQFPHAQSLNAPSLM